MKMGERHLFSDLESGTKKTELSPKEERKPRVLLGMFTVCVIVLVAVILLCGAGEAAAAQRSPAYEILSDPDKRQEYDGQEALLAAERKAEIELAVYLLYCDLSKDKWDAPKVCRRLQRMGAEWDTDKSRRHGRLVELLVREKAALANTLYEEMSQEINCTFSPYEVPEDLGVALDKLFKFQRSDEIASFPHEFHQQIANKLNKLETPIAKTRDGFYSDLQKKIESSCNRCLDFSQSDCEKSKHQLQKLSRYLRAADCKNL
jgi:curved DNA-binding protein CbpA